MCRREKSYDSSSIFDLYYNSSFLILWIISPVMSLLAQYFAQQQFCVLVEYLSAHQAQWSVKTEFAGFPVAMTLADRVHADDDEAPLQVAKQYPQEIEKSFTFRGRLAIYKTLSSFCKMQKHRVKRTCCS